MKDRVIFSISRTKLLPLKLYVSQLFFESRLNSYKLCKVSIATCVRNKDVIILKHCLKSMNDLGFLCIIDYYRP